jgi:hypothetical protein
MLKPEEIEEFKEKIEEGKKIIEKVSFLKYAMARDQVMECVFVSSSCQTHTARILPFYFLLSIHAFPYFDTNIRVPDHLQMTPSHISRPIILNSKDLPTKARTHGSKPLGCSLSESLPKSFSK